MPNACLHHLARLLAYLQAGGWLMLPLVALAFAIALTAIQAAATHDTDSSTLAALVAAAPLVGLLGTVIGMGETFSALAQQQNADALLANGIAKALVTTQTGLAIAIPGAFVLAVLKTKRPQNKMSPQNPQNKQKN